MTRRDIVYDIITIAKKAGYTDDDMLDEDYLGYKIDEKRAKEIRDSYDRNKLIDPIWIQDFGVTDLTHVNFADDKSLTFLNDCKLGKVTLPPVVSFHNSLSATGDLGINSILSASGSKQYHFMPFNQLMMQINRLSDGSVYKLFGYYTKIHNAIYVTGDATKIRPLLILSRPLDGYVISSEYVTTGNLVVGTSYTVMSGQIVHNSIARNKDAVFTAVNTTFTGTGLVQYTNQKRAMTDLDEYPLSNSQVEIVIMKILTQELQIQKAQITDIRNNSQDSLKTLQPSND